MKVLEISASGRRGDSVSRMLTGELIDSLEAREGEIEVQRRDLSDGIPLVDEAWINANFTADEDRTAQQRETLAASDALYMATMGGARAMGLDEQIGSLEVGKQADVIAVDLSGPECQPLYNPLSQLVYSCNGSQVTHSWVAGSALMERREFTRIELPALLARAAGWQETISKTRSP